MGNIRMECYAVSTVDEENLPVVKKDTSPVVAVCAADLHLDSVAPAARKEEPDWWVAQTRPLAQIRALCDIYHCPLIVAGDFFHRYYASPQTINFALTYLPEPIYGVYGNHDLPEHNPNELRRSAFWTLVEAGKVHLLQPSEPLEVGTLRLHGFPYGTPLTPNRLRPHDLLLDVAVVHSFIWSKKTADRWARDDQGLDTYRQMLVGYDAAVFGDNHKPFYARAKEGRPCHVLNCGSLMRRTVDQRDYNPAAWLLHQDGSFTKQLLDCNADKLTDTGGDLAYQPDEALQEALAAASGLAGRQVDFEAELRRAADRTEVSPAARQLLLSFVERTR